ncbi:hypothetical protein ACWEPC_29175 [Nonomuraea sp. NPDC004297]
MTVHNTRNGPERLGVPPDLSAAELFDAHFAEIHRYIARRLSADVADDLAADVFVVAVGGGYDPSVGAARRRLYGIATNLVARHRSRRVKGRTPGAWVRHRGSASGRWLRGGCSCRSGSR